MEAVEPPTRFTFRWLPEPGQPSGLRTRVELTLEESDAGTLLTVVERSLWTAGDAGDAADHDDALAGAR